MQIKRCDYNTVSILTRLFSSTVDWVKKREWHWLSSDWHFLEIWNIMLENNIAALQCRNYGSRVEVGLHYLSRWRHYIWNIRKCKSSMSITYQKTWNHVYDDCYRWDCCCSECGLSAFCVASPTSCLPSIRACNSNTDQKCYTCFGWAIRTACWFRQWWWEDCKLMDFIDYVISHIRSDL